ncbi:MAG TPA: DHHA1 domain-containing protein [bacterium]|nr:DHHA1 domain-containing protein [bacterium]
MHRAARIAETLQSRRSVLLLNHVAPDGDCLGSTLALAQALRARGQRAVVGSADGLPTMYQFLPGSEQVVAEIPAGETFDAVVFMECSSPERAGGLVARAAGVPVWVNIDHHVSNSGYGDLVLLDTEAAAVAEVVLPIVKALHPVLDADTATCLLTALLTDTGGFHHASVTPRSFQIAAELVAAGASPTAVYTQVYENRSVGSLRLLGMALSRLTVAEAGRVVWTVVTQAMLKEAGASMDESEGIVGAIRAIRGAQVAVLFKEEPEGIHVSLRAQGGVRANVIAEAFGGGGHAAAAGFTIKEALTAAIDRTLDVVRRELAASNPTAPGGAA